MDPRQTIEGRKAPFPKHLQKHSGPVRREKVERVPRSSTPPITPITDVTTLHDASHALQSAFDRACEEHMTHKRMPKSKGNRWWNQECRSASDALRTASADGVEEDIKGPTQTSNASQRKPRESGPTASLKEGMYGRLPDGGRGGRIPRSQGFAPRSLS
jgi:hypothetical protein